MTLLLEQPKTARADTGQGSASVCRMIAPDQCSPSCRETSMPVRWVAAHTVTHRHVAEAVTVYDCVRLAVVRDGSIILRGDVESHPMSAGDVVLVAPGVGLGWEPEGRAVVTTVLLDTDYLLGLFFWQHLDHAADLADAATLAARMYPDPIQILRLGEHVVERLGPVLDELTDLSDQSPEAAGFFRLQSLVDELLGAVTPHVRTAPGVRWPVLSGPHVGLSRWRLFHPAPRLVAETAAMMRANPANRWRLGDLAAHACFSESQYVRRFHHAYGMSPFAYLALVRVREMARLLRETDMPVLAIFEHVGWGQTNHAAVVFRHTYGTTPRDYRRNGPATASTGGPGVAVGRAADARGNRCAPTY